MAIRDRKRAAFALRKVREGAGTLDDKPRAKYKTWLVKLPTHLHVNGLGQTVAFYLAEGEESPKAEICGWLGDWLQNEVAIYPTGNSLIERITGGDDQDYRRASAEARHLSLWLKRFAEAFL